MNCFGKTPLKEKGREMNTERESVSDSITNYVTIKRNLELIERKFDEIERQLEISEVSIVVKQLIQELKELML